MPTAAVNGVELYYEDTGRGFPVVFCHEFAGDYRAWEPQVRAFDRLYRCVTPGCVAASWSWEQAPARPTDSASSRTFRAWWT